jgi:molecular chaperone DnaJ
MRCHPDKGGSEEEFKKINEAYSVLMGKQKPSNIQHNEPNFGGFNPFDFDINFDHIRDIFNRSNRTNPQTSTRRQYAKPPEKEKDLKISFEMSIEDIKKGKEFSIKYHQSKPCTKCNGAGGTQKVKCSQCNGQGNVTTSQQQGNFYFSSTVTCPNCQGFGEVIENICNECEGNGFKIIEKELTFIVKEK